MKDFSFQGRIELGTRLAGGKPGLLTWVGDQSSCELRFNTENADRTEQFSGQRLQSARLRQATTVELNLVLRYGTAHNLQLGLYATPQAISAATVVDELLPEGLVAGSRIVLDKPANVQDLVIQDASGSPVTLVAGEDYRLESPHSGIIEMIDVSTLTQPFSASYKHDAFTSLPFFTAQPPERYLYLNGINTVSGERVRLHLYRIQFNPFDTLALINPEFGELPLSGTAMFDVETADDPLLGGFGRIELPSEA
ncbi:MAG: hypothetical protein AB7D31_07540 [Stenotrophomonas sp.]